MTDRSASRFRLPASDPTAPQSPDERRVAAIAIATAAGIFGILLLVVPPFFISFDEAKYIGIGYNLVDGLGPRTPFGGYFLSHAPLWSAILVVPSLVGIAPLDVGHVLDGLAGVGLVVLAAALGWRIRPAVGGLAAAGTIAITYLHDLTRTARLDVPVAFLVLAFLLVGFMAVRNGKIGWAIALGALFAVSFEVKEIALPLFPVPFLAGILWGRPWRSLARTAGWTILAATVGLSWWFLLVAQLSGVVYRLETPAWTLVPITVLVVGAAALAILGSRLEDKPGILGLERRLRLGTTDDGRIGSGRVALVIAITVAWCAALLFVFGRELGVRGSHIIDLPQFGRYGATWLPGALKVGAAAGAIGVLLSVAAWRSGRGGERSAIVDLWLAVICSAPLIVLVIDVGEPPRNYLAQLAILAALSGAGWLWLVERLAARVVGRRRGAPAPGDASDAGEERARRGFAPLVPVVLVIAVAGSGLLLAAHALSFRGPRGDQGRADALRTTVAWVEANVPAGTKVAIGSLLSYEISLGLRGRNPTAQVRDVLAMADPAAPQGIRVAGRPAQDDWVAIDVAPRSAHEFQAFSASQLTRDLRTSKAAYWIYVTEAATSSPTIVPALVGASGVRQVAAWTWPTPTVPIGVHIYAIDPAALSFPTNRVVVSPEALERLVTELEAAKGAGQATAARLVPMLEVSPSSSLTDGLLVRLRRLAGP